MNQHLPPDQLGKPPKDSTLRLMLKATEKALRQSPLRGPRATTGDTSGDPPDSLMQRTERREWHVGTLLAVPSASSMLMTYSAASDLMTEQSAGLLEKGQALAFAGAFGTLSWTGWFVVSGLVSQLSGPRLMGAVLAGTIYTGGVAAVDAPFNMAALAGDRAVQLSLVDTTRQYEAARIEITRRTAIAHQLLPMIRAQAERFKASAENETHKGSRTGQPGPGKVSDSIGQVGGLLEKTGDQLEVVQSEISALDQEVSQLLGEMKQVAFRPGPMRERAQALSSIADRVDALLGAIYKRDATPSIKATATALAEIFPAPADAGSAFERIQNAEIARIAEMAKPIAKSLDEALQGLGDEASMPTPARPLDAAAAVRHYWRELLPQWAAAAFIDFAPGILLLIFVAARREAALSAIPTPKKKEPRK